MTRKYTVWCFGLLWGLILLLPMTAKPGVIVDNGSETVADVALTVVPNAGGQLDANSTCEHIWTCCQPEAPTVMTPLATHAADDDPLVSDLQI